MAHGGCPDSERILRTSVGAGRWHGPLAWIVLALSLAAAQASQAAVPASPPLSDSDGRALAGAGASLRVSAQTRVQGPEPSMAEGSVALRCRINGAPWQPCAMEIDRLGEHWWLVIGVRRFEFQHDGHGQVTLSDTVQGPRRVTPEWRGQGVLCWGDLCAEGAIPLD